RKLAGIAIFGIKPASERSAAFRSLIVLIGVGRDLRADQAGGKEKEKAAVHALPQCTRNRGVARSGGETVAPMEVAALAQLHDNAGGAVGAHGEQRLIWAAAGRRRLHDPAANGQAQYAADHALIGVARVVAA